MAFDKPDLTRVWAETAPPGNVVDPDVTTPGKWGSGWQVEIPPFEHFNYLQQSFSGGLAHLNQQGVMRWDANTEYDITGLAKGSDDQVYRSLVATNQGNDPVSSPMRWEVVTMIGRWNANRVYNTGDVALTTAGELYRSLVDSNVGNDPATSPNQWDAGIPVQDSVPPGFIAAYGYDQVPDGYLECNGAAVSRTAYAALFAAIDTAWGTGDGSTTFNLPDFRGVFIRGWDNGAGHDPGRGFGTLQNDDFKAHTHTSTIYHSHSSVTLGASTAHWLADKDIQTAGTGGAETRPKNRAAFYIIKY